MVGVLAGNRWGQPAGMFLGGLAGKAASNVYHDYQAKKEAKK